MLAGGELEGAAVILQLNQEHLITVRYLHPFAMSVEDFWRSHRNRFCIQ